MKKSLENLRNEYVTLNNSFKEQLIFPLTNRGFFSEINNLSLAVLFCLENKINFSIYTKNWVSGKWSDYFNPTFEEYKGLVPIPSHTVFNIKKIEILYSVYHEILKNRMILQNGIWHEMRSHTFTGKTFFIPKLEIDGDIFHAKKQIQKLILDYDQNTIKNSFDAIQQFDFISNSVGIHVRRGDKIKELNSKSGFLNIHSYINKAISIDPSANKFTICTDDYSVIEEFKTNYPDFEFFTFCQKSKKGYSQNDFNNLKSDLQIKNETYGVLRDAYILISSKLFIGAHTSNLSRFVALERNNINCHSLDVDWYPI